MQGKGLALVLTILVAVLLVLFAALSQPSQEDDGNQQDLEAAIQDHINRNQEVQLSVVGYSMFPSEITVVQGGNVTLVVSSDRSAVFRISNQDLEATIGPELTVSLLFDTSKVGNYNVELHFPIPAEQAGNEAAILLSEPIRIGVILVK